MSLRVSLELALAVGFGNALDDTAFEREKTELLDTLDNVESGTRLIAAEAVDEEIGMGGVTQGRMLYIEADGEFSVKFSSNDPVGVTCKRMIDPTSTAAENTCAYFLATAQFSEVFISNPSTTTAIRIKFCIVGDLTT